VDASWRECEADAAATLRECCDAFAARGSNPLLAVTGGAAAPVIEWRHYPDGEVYDPQTHTQYFFHAHPMAQRSRNDAPPEAGHFHLFLRGEGIPPGITPLVLPEAAVANAPAARQSAPLKRGNRDELCHLVALGLDHLGEPVRLFTTNRWVTGETWYRADDVIRMLSRFASRAEHPSALLSRWLGALVCLFEPEIAVLLRRRDKAIADRRWRKPADPLEDGTLEVTSSCEIDVAARLAAIDARRIDAAAYPTPSLRLPRMAEGWGA